MKKSICFVVTQGEFGGAQRYVFDLAKSLNGQYKIFVIVGSERAQLQKKLQEAGISVRTSEHLIRNIRPLKELLAVRELQKIFRELKPDIVHLNSSKAGVIGSLAGYLAGVKNIIFTAHGFAFLEPHRWIVKQIYFWAEKFASYFRRKIICVSNFDREEAIKWGLCKPEKLVTIHNGISFPVIASDGEAISNKTGIASALRPRNDETITIGTIANLYKTKGLEYLIEAATILNDKYKILETKFFVIGEGSERNKLESQIMKSGLENIFFLLGAKENAFDYLSTFDIFVLPSIKEGFPYALLGAMAAGLPIVATSVGGIPEALVDEKEGVLVPPKDAKALAEALDKLQNNPLLAKALGANARERVKEFSLEKMTRNTLAIYREILEKN